jgi:Glycine zipper 2TM domain
VLSSLFQDAKEEADMCIRELKIWVVAAIVMVVMAGQGRAADRGIDGLILGAGGGALVGQAIGRDKEATLIGTAVGGMLGYMVGNEVDNASADGGYAVSRAGFPLPPLPPPPSIVFSYNHSERDRDHYRERWSGKVCWEERVWVERRHGGYRQEWRTVCRDRHRHGQKPWHEDRHRW